MILKSLWMLPMTILSLLYLLPLWALGWVRFVFYVYEKPRVPVFFLNVKTGWYARAWGRWNGFAGPGWVILSPYTVPLPSIDHELAHVQQWRRWGVFFPVAYLAALVWFGYENNPFEKEARAAE